MLQEELKPKRTIATESISKKEKVTIEETTINEELKEVIVGVFGHVDAGKTSLLDAMTDLTIQQKESGGITQSIRCVNVDYKTIRNLTSRYKGKFLTEVNLPGILFLDTPGHASFSNMRSTGSNLCNMALVIIDIMEGIKPQTKEVITLLKEKKVPFIVVTTKIDRMQNWKKSGEMNLKKVLDKQSREVNDELICKIEDIKYELSSLDIEAEYFVNNKKLQSIYSILPVSNKSKEGYPDLISLIVYISQNWLSKKITFKDTLKATILKSYQDSKNGNVIDVLLANGEINKSDEIVVSTSNGPSISKIKNLLQLVNGKKSKSCIKAKASKIITIIANNLENSIVGTQIYINSEENLLKAGSTLDEFWKAFQWKKMGVYILANSTGEFEAMYDVLDNLDIPILGGEIGILNKKIIQKYSNFQVNEKLLENRVIIYFSDNIKNEDEIRKFASSENISIIQSDIIYQLGDNYLKFKEDIIVERKKQLSKLSKAIYPCELKILPEHIYMKGGKSDLVFGIRVIDGRIIKGTILSAITNNGVVEIGKVTSMQKNNKEVDKGNTNDEICIKVSSDKNILLGKNFTKDDTLISKLTRDSIDLLKRDYRDDMEKKDWLLVIKHKKLLNII